jgi:hypothetical protein
VFTLKYILYMFLYLLCYWNYGSDLIWLDDRIFFVIMVDIFINIVM